MAQANRETSGREGFALLAVLWVITGIAVLGLAALFVARSTVATAMNRADTVRAFWRAEDCLARVRVLVGEVLAGRAVDAYGYEISWAQLDQVIPSAHLVDVMDCQVEVHPVGATLNVNEADGEMLRAVFLALGASPERADSLVDAVLDWRDADSVPRPFGAEREWYEAQGRHLPRNGPLADPRELRRIRGLESVPDLESVLGVESGRLSLTHAPAPVLAAIPGFGPEAVQQVLELRTARHAVLDLATLGDYLTSSARSQLMARFADAVRVATGEPEGWIVLSRGRAGAPPITVELEVKLVRAGSRAAVVRRRIWLQ
jgi:general secretion pathway protein K